MQFSNLLRDFLNLKFNINHASISEMAVNLYTMCCEFQEFLEKSQIAQQYKLLRLENIDDLFNIVGKELLQDEITTCRVMTLFFIVGNYIESYPESRADVERRFIKYITFNINETEWKNISSRAFKQN